MMKWFSSELSPEQAAKLKTYLVNHNIKFSTSECFNLIHFDILLEAYGAEYNKLNRFIDKLET